MDTSATITNPNIKLAVITNNESILNLFTLYEKGAVGSPWEVKYFPGIKHAYKWLLN